MSVFTDLFAGGRTLSYAIHGVAATYTVASTGVSSSVTLTGYEQLGATDDKEIFSATIRASEVAAPAEGDYFVFSGETTRRVLANIRTQPDGSFTLRGWSRTEKT